MDPANPTVRDYNNAAMYAISAMKRCDGYNALKHTLEATVILHSLRLDALYSNGKSGHRDLYQEKENEWHKVAKAFDEKCQCKRIKERIQHPKIELPVEIPKRWREKVESAGNSFINNNLKCNCSKAMDELPSFMNLIIDTQEQYLDLTKQGKFQNIVYGIRFMIEDWDDNCICGLRK